MLLRTPRSYVTRFLRILMSVFYPVVQDVVANQVMPLCWVERVQTRALVLVLGLRMRSSSASRTTRPRPMWVPWAVGGLVVRFVWQVLTPD